MKLKYCVGLLLCVILIATPIGSEIFDKDTDLNVLNAALPALAGLVGMCVAAVPVGPLLVAGLGVIHIASMIMYGGDDDGEIGRSLTNLDLMKYQSAIINEVQKVDRHVLEESERIIRELTHTIKSQTFFVEMRNALEYLKRKIKDETEVVLNPKITGFQKNSTMALMEDPHSQYRDTMRFFVSKFIKPQVYMPVMGPSKFFYEHTLDKDQLLAVDNEDSHTDSMHSQLFKAYMFIAKILTDSYVLPIAAETIQYQEEVKQGRDSDAASTKRDTFKLINDYKSDMKALIDKTKWALENASRVIKNTGTVYLKEGENFERLQFAHTIPRIFTLTKHGCVETDNGYFKTYAFGDCHSYGDLIPSNSKVSIFKNPQDPDRPFEYMISTNSDGDEVVFGHKSSNVKLIEDQVTLNGQCPSVFCSAFKKKAVGISTERVRAKPGNVITGTRMRVEKGILYVDIQEGKYLDILSVDPKTVHWTKTPTGGSVAYLSSGIRKLELGDFELKDNEFLTSIQLKQGALRDGLISVIIEGAKPPNWYNFPQGSVSRIPKAGELFINGDDPQMLGFKNLISKVPEKSIRHFVRFQQTSFEDDFGRTTIPYIDTREVVSDPPAPLSGFSIYHQAGDNSGGIVSLKLLTPKLTSLASYDEIEKFVETTQKVV